MKIDEYTQKEYCDDCEYNEADKKIKDVVCNSCAAPEIIKVIQKTKKDLDNKKQ